MLSAPEKAAIERALDAGAHYCCGNVMAWLATEWACSLRDDWGLPEKVAIDAVSGRGPYPLPSNAALTGGEAVPSNGVVGLCGDCAFIREPNRHSMDSTPLPRCGRTGACVRYDHGCSDGKHNNAVRVK